MAFGWSRRWAACCAGCLLAGCAATAAPAVAPSNAAALPAPKAAPRPDPIDPLATPAPMSPDVRLTKLDSGLTVFVRRSELPKARAALWLVSKAGSVLEDDDQRGVAHFVEHMAFNGTTHFPK